MNKKKIERCKCIRESFKLYNDWPCVVKSTSERTKNWRRCMQLNILWVRLSMFYKGYLNYSSYGCLINKSALRCKSTGFILHDYLLLSSFAQSVGMPLTPFILYHHAKQRRTKTINRNIKWKSFELNLAFKNTKRISTFLFFYNHPDAFQIVNIYPKQEKKLWCWIFFPHFFLFNQEYRSISHAPGYIHTIA